MSSTWIPDLGAGDGPVYERLAQALGADIQSGRLKAGDRLPPQRDLAFALGIGVGTVTRAYAEAERRGLLDGQVGRGSFVAGARAAAPRQGAGPLDLSRSVPPGALARQAIAGALARLARRPDLADRLSYAPEGGFPEDRAAGAHWLGQVHEGLALDPDQVLLCAGAQEAVAVALTLAVRPGQALIAEAATFAGLKSVAAVMDYRLVGAAMDDHGLTPEGLARAARDSGARAAYVLPTQNPTGRVMGPQRRRDIAEVARALDLILIEDDLYGAYAGGFGWPRRAPIAAHAPERCLFVSALSKSVAPGLRVGWLVPPATGDWRERALSALHGLTLGAPTFGALIGTNWIEDGTAEAILADNRRVLAERAALALAVLGDAVEAPALAAPPHLWLPMGELEAERVAARALREGVELTPAGGPILDGRLASGLRLCLGAAPDAAALEQGLAALKSALSLQPAPARGLV